MKKIYSIVLLISLISCAPGKFIPLKNTYNREPYVINSTKSKDEVWDNVIDLFAQRGISIRIIDKSSGLIISNTKEDLTVTTEDKNGKMLDTTAAVVAPRYYDANSKRYYKPELVTGEWNVRIKEVPGGSTINVNLLNIVAEYYYTKINAATYNKTPAAFKSTGFSTHKFEALLASYINK